MSNSATQNTETYYMYMLKYYKFSIPQTNHSTSLVYFDLTFPWSLIHLRPAAKVSSPKQGCCHRAYVFSARKSHLKLIFWSLAIQSVFLPTLRYYLILCPRPGGPLCKWKWPYSECLMHYPSQLWANYPSCHWHSDGHGLHIVFCAWIQLTVSMQSWCKTNARIVSHIKNVNANSQTPSKTKTRCILTKTSTFELSPKAR